MGASLGGRCSRYSLTAADADTPTKPTQPSIGRVRGGAAVADNFARRARVAQPGCGWRFWTRMESAGRAARRVCVS